MAENDEPAPALPAGWYEGVDPTHKRAYYFNKRTRRSTWTKPEAAEAVIKDAAQSPPPPPENGARAVPPAEPQSSTAASHDAHFHRAARSRESGPVMSRSESGDSHKSRRPLWVEFHSAEHDRPFYFNRKTKESRWTRPPEPSELGGERDAEAKMAMPSPASPASEVPALRTAWDEIAEARKHLEKEREEHMLRVKEEWRGLQTQIKGLRELAANAAPATFPRDEAPLSRAELGPAATAGLQPSQQPSPQDAGAAAATQGFVMLNGDGAGGSAPLATAAAAAASQAAGASQARAAAGATATTTARAPSSGTSFTAGLLLELEEYADSLVRRRESITNTARARGDSGFDQDAYIAEMLEGLDAAERERLASAARGSSRPYKTSPDGPPDRLMAFAQAVEKEMESVDAQLNAIREEAEGVRRVERQVRELEEGCFYKLLEVEPDVTPAQLKKAYYQRMREFHPDKLKTSGISPETASFRTTQIGQAYAVLSDPWERKIYDRCGVQQYLIHANVVQCFINFLVTGTRLKKHPHGKKRYGWRFLDKQFVQPRDFWLAPDHAHLNVALRRNLEPSEKELERIKRIPVEDVLEVTKGIQTDVFAATGTLKRESRYFSVITKDRSYDLEAPDFRQRDFLVSRLTLLVIHLQKNESWFDKFYAERNPKKKKKKKKRQAQQHHRSMGADGGSRGRREDSQDSERSPRRASSN